MSEPALARLIEGTRLLTRALDDGAAADIEIANVELAEAVTAIAAAGAWREQPQLRDQLLHARALLDAARARLNYLADHAARRLDRLSALTGAPRTTPYGRTGRRH